MNGNFNSPTLTKSDSVGNLESAFLAPSFEQLNQTPLSPEIAGNLIKDQNLAMNALIILKGVLSDNGESVQITNAMKSLQNEVVTDSTTGKQETQKTGLHKKIFRLVTSSETYSGIAAAANMALKNFMGAGARFPEQLKFEENWKNKTGSSYQELANSLQDYAAKAGKPEAANAIIKQIESFAKRQSIQDQLAQGDESEKVEEVILSFGGKEEQNQKMMSNLRNNALLTAAVAGATLLNPLAAFGVAAARTKFRLDQNYQADLVKAQQELAAQSVKNVEKYSDLLAGKDMRDLMEGLESGEMKLSTKKYLELKNTFLQVNLISGLPDDIQNKVVDYLRVLRDKKKILAGNLESDKELAQIGDESFKLINDGFTALTSEMNTYKDSLEIGTNGEISFRKDTLEKHDKSSKAQLFGKDLGMNRRTWRGVKGAMGLIGMAGAITAAGNFLSEGTAVKNLIGGNLGEAVRNLDDSAPIGTSFGQKTLAGITGHDSWRSNLKFDLDGDGVADRVQVISAHGKIPEGFKAIYEENGITMIAPKDTQLTEGWTPPTNWTDQIPSNQVMKIDGVNPNSISSYSNGEVIAIKGQEIGDGSALKINDEILGETRSGRMVDINGERFAVLGKNANGEVLFAKVGTNSAEAQKLIDSQLNPANGGEAWSTEDATTVEKPVYVDPATSEAAKKLADEAQAKARLENSTSTGGTTPQVIATPPAESSTTGTTPEVTATPPATIDRNNVAGIDNLDTNGNGGMGGRALFRLSKESLIKGGITNPTDSQIATNALAVSVERNTGFNMDRDWEAYGNGVFNKLSESTGISRDQLERSFMDGTLTKNPTIGKQYYEAVEQTENELGLKMETYRILNAKTWGSEVTLPVSSTLSEVVKKVVEEAKIPFNATDFTMKTIVPGGIIGGSIGGGVGGVKGNNTAPDNRKFKGTITGIMSGFGKGALVGGAAGFGVGLAGVGLAGSGIAGGLLETGRRAAPGSLNKIWNGGKDSQGNPLNTWQGRFIGINSIKKEDVKENEKIKNIKDKMGKDFTPEEYEKYEKELTLIKSELGAGEIETTTDGKIIWNPAITNQKAFRDKLAEHKEMLELMVKRLEQSDKAKGNDNVTQDTAKKSMQELEAKTSYLFNLLNTNPLPLVMAPVPPVSVPQVTPSQVTVPPTPPSPERNPSRELPKLNDLMESVARQSEKFEKTKNSLDVEKTINIIKEFNILRAQTKELDEIRPGPSDKKKLLDTNMLIVTYLLKSYKKYIDLANAVIRKPETTDSDKTVLQNNITRIKEEAEEISRAASTHGDTELAALAREVTRMNQPVAV